MPEVEDDLADLAEELRFAVSGFVRSVRAKTGTPSTVRSEVLTLLERGPRNVAALAQLRNVTHQAMRLVVAQLEEQALVHRSSDPNDRRSQSVAITEQGRRWLSESRAARANDIADRLRAELSSDEIDALRAAIKVFRRLNEASAVQARGPQVRLAGED